MKYSLCVVENYHVLLSENRLCVPSGEAAARLDETDVAFFARWGVRGEVFGMADHTEADAFDVGVDAPLGEEGFPFGAVEHLVSAVDPARTPTEGVGGVEAREFVAHCAVGDDNNEGRLAAAACRGVGAGTQKTLILRSWKLSTCYSPGASKGGELAEVERARVEKTG